MPLEPPVRFTQITVEDGLPQSQANAFVQDARGFVWLGTQEGLARYDGRRFVTHRHDPADPDTMPSSFVSALALAGDGSLWIAHGEAGLSRYDAVAKRFVPYLGPAAEAAGDPSSAQAHLVHGDAKGRIWAGTADLGLLRYDEATDGFLPVAAVNDLTGPTITAIAARRGGGLWVASPEGVVAVADDLDAPHALDLRQNVLVTAIAEDADGRLWLGTAQNGLLAIDASSGAVIDRFFSGSERDTLTSDHITSLLVDGAGRLWVGTQDGLNLRDPSQPGFTRFVGGNRAANLSFPKNVLSLFEDDSGLLWVGTFTGLRTLDRRRAPFRTYAFDEPIIPIAADGDGSIWLGTYADGLYHIDRSGKTLEHRTHARARDGRLLELAPHWVTALLLEGETLWLAYVVAGEPSLVALDTATGEADDYGLDTGSLEIERVDTIYRARDGGLWLATWGAGLLRIDVRAGRIDLYTPAEAERSFPSTFAYTIREDRKVDGLFWVGTADAGLVRLDTNAGTFQSFARDTGGGLSIGHDSVVSVHQDEAGAVWAGTYGGGLARLSPSGDEVRRYTASEGLPSDTIFAILPDASGSLWLSTNGDGLARLDPATGEVTRFDSRDGLQGNQFIQNSATAIPGGELVFGGMNGITVFDPGAVEPSSEPPKVVLTGIKIVNEPIASDVPVSEIESIALGHRDSMVTFEFAALSYAVPGASRYAYKLEGVHDDWIETTSPSVTYSNLDGGDYTFRVRAADHRGTWNEDGIALAVEVSPPPWKTWWAYLGYALLGLAAAGGVVAYQRRRIAALQQANRLAAVERDLELTGTLQTGFLPRDAHITAPNLVLEGFYRPADFASGDWWWYAGQEEASRHLILVGDVTGHGSGPAMITAAVATAFRVQVDEHDLDVKLRKVNREVFAAAQGKYHVTMSVVELDSASGSYRFHSAGGLPMLRLPASGRVRAISARGTPLGMTDLEIGVVEGQLEPGDRLCIFTDGIPEQNLTSGRMLGLRRLTKLLQETRELSIPEAVETIVRETDSMRGGEPQEDDWTIALFDWNPTGAGSEAQGSSS